MSDEKDPEPGELIKSGAPKPDGLKKDDVFDPARTAEDEEHARRMRELFPDLDDEDEAAAETLEDVRDERNELQAQVERLRTSVSRTRKENSALMQKVNEGKDAIAAVEELRSQDKKAAAKQFLGDLSSVAQQLSEGLKEIDAAERAANPKLDKLTLGVESTLNQLTAVFNKYGIKPGETAPAAAVDKPAAKPETPAAEPPKNETPAAPGDTPPPAAAEPPKVETIEALRAERDALRAEMSGLSTTVAKAQGDNLTLTRRIDEGKNLLAREEAKREEDKQFAIEKPLKELMPVIDTLELGLGSINAKNRAEDPNFDFLAKVVEGTLGNVRTVFNKHGIKQLNPLNEPFDSESHEAVTMQVRDGVDAMTVIHVVQKGYELNNRIVRHAKVVVTPPD